MASIIHTVASNAGIRIHDVLFDGSFFTTFAQLMDLSGSGEVYDCRCSSAVQIDTALRLASGPWLVHGNNFRVDDTCIHLTTTGTRSIIGPNRLQADNDQCILVEGNDNLIIGNTMEDSGLVVSGDDNLIIGNIYRNFNSTKDGFVVSGDRNFLDGNKIHSDFGSVPAVGIEIQSGATENIIGVNDVGVATTPITDAGTGTIYKAVREAVWVVGGALATGVGVDPRRINEDVFIIDAAIVVDTAPTDASLIVDVHLNGVTIFTTQGNRPTIVTTAKDSGLAVPDVTVAAGGDVLTVDIDQIGSTLPGEDLAVVVRYINTGDTG